MGSRILSNRKDLVGKIFSTKSYGDVKIIRYFKNDHIIVEFFNTGTYCSTSLDCVKRGIIKDLFAERRTKLIYGNGFSGVGIYRQSSHRDAYYVWMSMLKRCYDSKFHKIEQAYKECSVCDEWLNFQNFAEWYYKQPKEEGNQLDKDIIVKNNKIYGPSTCAFVPKKINTLFLKAKLKRGKYPIGVYFSEKCRQNPFISRCANGTGKYKLLGYFPSPDEAFMAYKTYKEKHIKQIAEEYRSQIDERVYHAMMKYQVEITD